MTQMRMSHKKKQPENKYSCISPLHLHTKVSQCPVCFYNPLAPKGLFWCWGRATSFILDLSSRSSQDDQPGLSITAQPILADKDFGSARVHQDITSLFQIKTSDAIKLYLYLWDKHSVIRNRKAVWDYTSSFKIFNAFKHLSFKASSVACNLFRAEPSCYSVFLQHLVQDLSMLYVFSRRISPFRPSSEVSKVTSLAAEAGICVWIATYTENGTLVIWCPALLPEVMLVLVPSPPSFKNPTVLVEPHLLVSSEMAKSST